MADEAAPVQAEETGKGKTKASMDHVLTWLGVVLAFGGFFLESSPLAFGVILVLGCALLCWGLWARGGPQWLKIGICAMTLACSIGLIVFVSNTKFLTEADKKEVGNELKDVQERTQVSQAILQDITAQERVIKMYQEDLEKATLQAKTETARQYKEAGKKLSRLQKVQSEVVRTEKGTARRLQHTESVAEGLEQGLARTSANLQGLSRYAQQTLVNDYVLAHPVKSLRVVILYYAPRSLFPRDDLWVQELVRRATQREQGFRVQDMEPPPPGSAAASIVAPYCSLVLFHDNPRGLLELGGGYGRAQYGIVGVRSDKDAPIQVVIRSDLPTLPGFSWLSFVGSRISVSMSGAAHSHRVFCTISSTPSSTPRVQSLRPLTDENGAIQFQGGPHPDVFDGQVLFHTIEPDIDLPWLPQAVMSAFGSLHPPAERNHRTESKSHPARRPPRTSPSSGGAAGTAGSKRSPE